MTFMVGATLLCHGTRFGKCLLYGYYINIVLRFEGYLEQSTAYLFDYNGNEDLSKFITATFTIATSHREC